ncbi:NUDIX hydrolase [Chitinophaga nivalis]|uniref:8-oxo-dGTP diphosphatase n=1 Tax=Chitinophaga nivalis TaxID=2991709 RepID=A0ABT3IH46_9BACT|nr:8-oxo-dGTP diphosphatase [Chitinophaga nivalis]MCW3467178.1 8-oxo-dGTP diphosphatase [Chitinophaga nivalis]MCW3483130.1 8-oxo-dGTP diphosphatase [Chitinophaga nivalis]
MNSSPTFPEGLKKTAVLCILRNGNRFLLLKRLKAPNKDQYTPVGGKLDPYETPLDAAIRETWEETGIRVDTMQYCGILAETSPVAYNWVSFVYVADIADQPAPPCNEGTLEWISYEQIPDLPTPTSDWYIYQYLRDSKTFVFNAVYDAALTLLHMTDEPTSTVVYRQP